MNLPTTATITAIYNWYESHQDPNRAHLGASLIGHECARALWYVFRWASATRHNGRILRLFQRGHREEIEFNKELRAVGVEVYETDPNTGKQWNYKAVGGHFGLSLDGLCKGLLEDPDQPHTLEFKTSSGKLFAKLCNDGVERAKPEHYAQMQIGMHYSKIHRCFYLCVNKDDDNLYSEIVTYNQAIAQGLAGKAERIITATTPSPKLSEDSSFYKCKWCNHKAICHEGEIPEVNCRTCCHSTPELDGDGRWSCAYYKVDLDLETQRQSVNCPAHLFIPPLLPWKVLDANVAENWVQYENHIRNGGDGFTSQELKINPLVCADPLVKDLKKAFDAEVVA